MLHSLRWRAFVDQHVTTAIQWITKIKRKMLTSVMIVNHFPLPEARGRTKSLTIITFHRNTFVIIIHAIP